MGDGTVLVLAAVAVACAVVLVLRARPWNDPKLLRGDRGSPMVKPTMSARERRALAVAEARVAAALAARRDLIVRLHDERRISYRDIGAVLGHSGSWVHTEYNRLHDEPEPDANQWRKVGETRWRDGKPPTRGEMYETRRES